MEAVTLLAEEIGLGGPYAIGSSGRAAATRGSTTTTGAATAEEAPTPVPFEEVEVDLPLRSMTLTNLRPAIEEKEGVKEGRKSEITEGGTTEKEEATVGEEEETRVGRIVFAISNVIPNKESRPVTKPAPNFNLVSKSERIKAVSILRNKIDKRIISSRV